MSYSPKLASAFNDTQMRSEKIAPSGMCSFCAEECVGTCEIGVSAMRGEMAVYPTNTGANQVASEKVMPIDWSHFNINGRVFGAVGAAANGDVANDFSTGAIGTYSYLARIRFGLQHFAALNRKFDLAFADQSDLIPLTLEAREILAGRWFV